MRKATNQFSKEEINAIEAAIGEVEKSTSAEVVPVVASVSGRYDRAEDVFSFLFSLLILIVAWDSIQKLASIGESWGEPSTLNSILPLTIGVLAISFAIGIALASRLVFGQYNDVYHAVNCVNPCEPIDETFQKLRIRNTENSTGLLIYVSLYEHRVHIVGDDTINQKLAQGDWNEIRDTVINGFKQGNASEGLTSGIRKAGELLSRHFPIEQGDRNELSNTLHLID